MSARVQFDQQLRQELCSIVGEDYVIDDLRKLEPHTHDSSPFPPVAACITLRPSSAEEISNILRLANDRKFNVSVRGLGLSMTGRSSLDPVKTVVIDTTRLNNIHEIDEGNMLARVGCGAVMGNIERELAKRGLYIHTVTVPLDYVTVGGVLSGVVGGGLPPRRPVYGTGVNFVLGLRVVLPQGDIMSTGAGGSNVCQKVDYIKGGNGPDVLGLFIGDGGIFGVKVEATLQMFPEPVQKQGGIRIFKNFEAVWKTLSKLMMLEPLQFSRLRIIDRDMDYSMEYVIETSVREMLLASANIVSRIASECGGIEGTKEEKEIAMKLAETSEMRSEKFVKHPRYYVSFMSERGGFPSIYSSVKDLILGEISKKHLDKSGAEVRMAFQPTLRNSMFCTFNIQFDPDNEDNRSGILALGNRAYEKVIELGGSPQPHQGFGADLMARYWSKEYRKVMRGIKQALDPNLVLNPTVWNLS